VHTSLFFKLFPPPKFLLTSHAGIDISDDAISFIEYSGSGDSRTIKKYGYVGLPPGLVEGGDIKDEKKFGDILSALVREHGLSYGKISIPEEKAYLFETDVPYGDSRAISQNIEFKLEENIPLAASDAVFAFDLLPPEAGKAWRASVSAVPRSYIERMMTLLRAAGIMPISFETAPRAIARVVSEGAPGASIIVHVMSRKTGIYVVSERAVGFTSTVGAGSAGSDAAAYAEALAAEVRRVYAYWLSRNDAAGVAAKRVIIVGADAESATDLIRGKVSDIVPVEAADVWRAVFDVTRYVPPITKNDSFKYAPAAGLAL
jgi:hypothetical protein